jgi:hypothetical protein
MFQELRNFKISIREVSTEKALARKSSVGGTRVSEVNH